METYQKHIVILLLIYFDIGLGFYWDFDIMWVMTQSLFSFVMMGIVGSKEPKESSHSSFIPLDFYSDGGTGTM
jgi:hypothetical protein